MAGEALLVSSASVGRPPSVSTPSIANATPSLAPAAIAPTLRLGKAYVRDAAAPGGQVVIDLTALPQPEVRFDFTPALRPITAAGAIPSPGLGQVMLTVTDSINPAGLDAPELTTRHRIQEAAAFVTLDLPGGTRAIALQMAFSPGALITSAGAYAGSTFGATKILFAGKQAQPSGLDATTFGRHLVARAETGWSVALDLHAPSGAAVALQLSFAGAGLMMVQGADQLSIGTAVAKNGSAALKPAGIAAPAPSQQGRTLNASLGGANLVFDFVTVKTQSGANVALPFYSVVRDISPSGWETLALGEPWVVRPQAVSATGYHTALLGEPAIELLRRQVFGGVGASTTALGKPLVFLRDQYVSPAGLAAGGLGTQRVEHWLRTLLVGGTAFDAYGASRISNANRTLAPVGMHASFPSWHMVGGSRYLRPVGFEATRFGERIIPPIQTAYPLGFAGLYGTPDLYNLRQTAAAKGYATETVLADRWGIARTYNLRQYITQVYDPSDGLNPPSWPIWTEIHNRNRTIGAVGWASPRFGYQQIDNKARPVQPYGIAAQASPKDYRAGLVAFRLRTYYLEGIEAPYFAGWSAVYNGARLLKPAGGVATLFGNCALANTRRYFPYIGGFDSAWCGYPMVAERVRTLSFEVRYTIGAPLIPLPTVKLHTRYVDGIGYDASGVGWASLSIHWQRITPRWTLQNLYGTPEVRNLTPELRTRGRASDEFGDAFVRLEWRPVAPDGALTQLFGKTIIAFRDRAMFVTGFRAGTVSDKLTVVKTGAPPYSMQTINLDSEWFDGKIVKEGNGIPPPYNSMQEQTGRPIINQQVLYVRQDEPATKYGNHRVTANSIRVEPGYGEYLVGEPFVALKVRTLEVAEFPAAQVFEPEKPRLSPHTIYAVMEAPAQAKLNHPLPPGRTLHFVDGFNRQPGAIFGRADVMLWDRVIHADFRPSQWVMPGYGRPTLQLKRHYITPTGFSSFRSGWHTVPGPQEAVQYDSASFMAMGQPKVAPPPYIGPQTIKGIGLASQAFGATWVELFNRTIYPAGYLATLMGTRKPGDTPYMWQGLRVGPLMPTIPVGVDMARQGEPWVSFRVRELGMEGFDSFLSEYQLEAFDKRMRVWRVNPPRPARTITPVGILAFDSAASDVRPGVHFIRPDGNADQYRKGAF